MSYDTSVIIDTGGEYPAEVEEVGNMTSNIGKMYAIILPGPYEGGGKYDGYGDPDPRCGLPGLSGLSCTAVLPVLEGAIDLMHEYKERLLKLEPENGWGSYYGALGYLIKIKDACERHPLGTLAVNW